MPTGITNSYHKQRVVISTLIRGSLHLILKLAHSYIISLPKIQMFYIIGNNFISFQEIIYIIYIYT
ncbi:hypothetical protein GKR41_p00024 (plasmid) [Candidatus Vallotia lariciata]|nr:hypothetical protein GKR41_p00024 [Candidatus Vallotia lariciata]